MKDICSFEAMMPIEQALNKIKELIQPIQQNERVILKQALNRVLAIAIDSSIHIPTDKNAVMDGYAFASQDIQPNQHFQLALQGISWAGQPFSEPLKKNHCVRIFTGAVIPDGADSVIMQEYIHSADDVQIIFPKHTKGQDNIRQIGSDIKKGQQLLPLNQQLSIVDIGLLASAGVYDVSVKRKLGISYFSTGDELCAIGQSLQQGQIYDSNRYILSLFLDKPTYNAIDLGVIVDDKQKIKQSLLNASKTSDVIITTGGASVGDADYIQEILEECGEVGFWKIAMKPGKPLAFGKINGCYFFGLPGNPVSTIATFQKIVLPALDYLLGLNEKKMLTITATCTQTLRKQQGRQDYQRGILSQDGHGQFFVKSAGNQASNMMGSMSKANCYIVLPIESGGVQLGEQVMVEPFSLAL